MTGTPVKLEPETSVSSPQDPLTPRELALANHLSTTLPMIFELRLSLVENRSMAFTQQQIEVVANLVRGVQAPAVPEAVTAPGQTAARMLQEQAENLARVHREVTGAADVAVQAARDARQVASQVDMQRQPPPDVPMVGVVPQNPVPMGMDGFLFQSIIPGLPTFAGDDPLKEGMTAEHMINHLEAMKCMHPALTDGQMITATASKFKKGSYAFNWWQNAIAGRAGEAFPFPNWATFKLAFSEAMRGPDQATAVRRQINLLRMQGDELGSYVSQFRSLFLRLRTLNSPMSEPDAVYLFAQGLSSKLKVHCPLTPTTTLSEAIDAVTEKHNRRQLINYISEDVRRERPRRSGRLYQLETEGEWDEQQGEWGEAYGTDNEEDEEEFVAMDNRGRGRGRGRGPEQRGGRAPVRGRGNRGRWRGRGGRGRGRGGERLPPEVEARMRAGQCLRCGAADHWVANCPVPRQENAQG